MTDNYTKIEGELEKEEEKTCTKCKESLPLSSFNKDSSRSAGRAYICKACKRISGGHTARKDVFFSLETEEKECRKCGKILSFSKFSMDAQGLCGRKAQCKICITTARGRTPRKERFFDLERNLQECAICHSILPFSNFYSANKGRYGLYHECISCMNAKRGITPRKPFIFDREAGIKSCSKCSRVLPLSEFTNQSIQKSGLSTRCKDCDRKYRIEHRDIIREYYNNRMSEDIEFHISTNLRSRLYQAVKGGYKSGSAVRDLGCSIPYLKGYLGGRFYTRATGEVMSWKVYGFYGWHIDHIKPLASFDLIDRVQLLEACNYINLQPLWSEDNLSKGDREDWSRW